MKTTVLAIALMAFATSSIAQELQVNEGEWNSLSATERQTIEQLMDQAFKGEELQITPAPDFAASSQEANEFLRGSAFCKPLCDIVAAGAIIGCASLTGPAAAVCISLTNQGKQLCYARCEGN